MGQTNIRALRAIRHGAYELGFLPCDRCTSNGSCEHFKPKARCQVEQDIFNKIVGELTEEFELDSLADKILVGRAAMYLIRILRAEAFDAGKGISEKGSAVGVYIARLDMVLRGLFNDLAVSRNKRKQLERGESLLVSLDDIMKKFAKAEQNEVEQEEEEPEDNEQDNDEQNQERQIEKRRLSQRPRRALLHRWQREYPRLRQVAKRRINNG